MRAVDNEDHCHLRAPQRRRSVNRLPKLTTASRPESGAGCSCVTPTPPKRVSIRIEGHAFQTYVEGNRFERFGLCERRRLLKRTSLALVWDQLHHVDHAPWEVCNAIMGNMERVIARSIDGYVQHALATVDPIVLAVQRDVFRATHRHSALTEADALYQERCLVKDVLQFEAAALALAEQRPRTRSVEHCISTLAHWKGTFSPIRQPYRSLNRTLMNLPPQTGTLAYELRHVTLERPVTNRLELHTLLTLLATLFARRLPTERAI